MSVAVILNEILNVSVVLSSEKHTYKLLESILLSAKRLSNADGGTIYSVNENNDLVFDTIFNDTLNMHVGGSSDSVSTLAPIPIYIDGSINNSAIVAKSAATGKVIRIDDTTKESVYDLTQSRQIDQKYSYQTKTMLTIPMKNHEGDLVGVLQLVNARKKIVITLFLLVKK